KQNEGRKSYNFIPSFYLLCINLSFSYFKFLKYSSNKFKISPSTSSSLLHSADIKLNIEFLCVFFKNSFV
ncbi:hypothetical protein ACWJV6_00005, partial [Clostridioides difficile]